MITVLSGVNQYAAHQKLSELRAMFIAEYSKTGVESYSGAQLQPDQLTSILSSATLFSQQRFIVIRDLSENKALADRFLTLLNGVSEDTQLVIVERQLDKRTVYYKTLKKEVVFHEFTPLSESELLRWITQTIENEGGSTTRQAARALYEYVGSDQNRLLNEINKLVTFNSEVSEKSVETLTQKDPKETIFQLLELVFSGRHSQALDMLASLEQSHEDPFAIINMLIWQVHILAIVFAAKNQPDAAVAKTAKINPFVVGKTRNLIRKMSPTTFNKCIESIAQLDLTLKSTSNDPWQLLAQAIIEINN